MEISIGMTREGFAKLSAEINNQLDTQAGVEVVRCVQHNGYGPDLRLVLSNDDMEGDHIPSPDTMLWEQF